MAKSNTRHLINTYTIEEYYLEQYNDSTAANKKICTLNSIYNLIEDGFIGCMKCPLYLGIGSESCPQRDRLEGVV